MFKYEVIFKGGSLRQNQCNFKFHLYLTNPEKGEEKHLYEAVRGGEADKLAGSPNMYRLAYPVVKVFTSTSGFGMPKEYFSFFVLINPESSASIRILPLGYDRITSHNFIFQTTGRFLTDQEIRRLYGANSNTCKFYNRQSFLSKKRLQSMVTVARVNGNHEEILTKPRVRKLRLK